MLLTELQKKKVSELLDTCKKYQGEYIPGDHGSGSWATTYSNEFIKAAAALYTIYKQEGFPSPLRHLSQAFREAGIRSCRGAKMDLDKTEYLYETHLKDKVVGNG